MKDSVVCILNTLNKRKKIEEEKDTLKIKDILLESDCVMNCIKLKHGSDPRIRLEECVEDCKAYFRCYNFDINFPKNK